MAGVPDNGPSPSAATGEAGRVCPKCGYERQPTDTAPDYECPRCQVVYAKVDPVAFVERYGESARANRREGRSVVALLICIALVLGGGYWTWQSVSFLSRATAVPGVVVDASTQMAGTGTNKNYYRTILVEYTRPDGSAGSFSQRVAHGVFQIERGERVTVRYIPGGKTSPVVFSFALSLALPVLALVIGLLGIFRRSDD